jgi:hypothetical protein
MATEAPAPRDAIPIVPPSVDAIACPSAQFCGAIGTYWSADNYLDVVPVLYTTNSS